MVGGVIVVWRYELLNLMFFMDVLDKLLLSYLK